MQKQKGAIHVNPATWGASQVKREPAAAFPVGWGPTWEGLVLKAARIVEQARMQT